MQWDPPTELRPSSASLVHVSTRYGSPETAPRAVIAKAENVAEALFFFFLFLQSVENKERRLFVLLSRPSRRPLTNATVTLDLAVKS